ncbi:MAG: DNA repair protein RadC [Chitinophagales bacterium]
MEYYENKMSIKAWAEADRPREKLLLKGKRSLSDAELMAILIGSGNAEDSAIGLCQKILKSCNNDLHELAGLSVKDLMKFKGIGEAKAISIVAALELGLRRQGSDIAKKPLIKAAADVYQYMSPLLTGLKHEEFWVLYLNRGNKVIHRGQLSSGGISGTIVDSRIIFKTALENLASSIILVHNHPSGTLKPSMLDNKLTQNAKQAGVIMDIPVLDHVIFTDNGYYSFADEGRL